jgi:hypothetical protein
VALCDITAALFLVPQTSLVMSPPALVYRPDDADFFIHDVPAHRFVLRQRSSLVAALLGEFPDAKHLTLPESLQNSAAILDCLRVLYGETKRAKTVHVLLVLDYLTQGTFRWVNLECTCDNVHDLLETGANCSVTLCDDAIRALPSRMLIHCLASKELATRNDFSLLRKIDLAAVVDSDEVKARLCVYVRPVVISCSPQRPLVDAVVEFFAHHPPSLPFVVRRPRQGTRTFMGEFDERLIPYVRIETYPCDY